MKKMAFVLVCLTFLVSCKQVTKVEFKKAVEIEMGNIKKEAAIFQATFVFTNLTEEEFSIKSLKLHFKIDGRDIGTIYNEDPKKIRGHSEFDIPIKYTYTTAPVVDNNETPESVYLIELEGNLFLKDKNGKEIVVPVKHKSSYTYKTKKEERLEKKEQRKAEKEQRKAEKKQLKNKT
jgi:hypothetical protein